MAYKRRVFAYSHCAVKPSSQRNGGFGADSGPSRGDYTRRAFRPIEASKVAICNGRFTSSPVRRCGNHASDLTPSDQRADIAKSLQAPNHETRHHVMSLSCSTRLLEAIAVRQDGVGKRRSGAALTLSGAHHHELHIGKFRQPV